MSSLKIFALAACLMNVASGYVTAEGADQEANHGSNIVFTFTIAGMSCEKCVVSITKTLKKFQGVTRVSVDFESASARVVADASMTTQTVRSVITPNSFWDDSSMGTRPQVPSFFSSQV